MVGAVGRAELMVLVALQRPVLAVVAL